MAWKRERFIESFNYLDTWINTAKLQDSIVPCFIWSIFIEIWTIIRLILLVWRIGAVTSFTPLLVYRLLHLSKYSLSTKFPQTKHHNSHVYTVIIIEKLFPFIAERILYVCVIIRMWIYSLFLTLCLRFTAQLIYLYSHRNSQWNYNPAQSVAHPHKLLRRKFIPEVFSSYLNNGDGRIFTLCDWEIHTWCNCMVVTTVVHCVRLCCCSSARWKKHFWSIIFCLSCKFRSIDHTNISMHRRRCPQYSLPKIEYELFLFMQAFQWAFCCTYIVFKVTYVAENLFWYTCKQCKQS